MADLPESLVLEPRDEARRLWEGAEAARARAGGDLASLFEALDLGVRAVEVAAVHRLEAARERFPATIGMRLEKPDPAVVPERDAAEAPPVLRFVEVVDLLSGADLPCASPALHSGWEDRRFSCRRSRATAQKAAGFALGSAEREALVLLAAYRNRVFRLPPPVRIVPGEILGAFPALESLFARLTA